MLTKLLHIAALYDFYGPLLTVKQRQCIEMHYLHDMSLSEIGIEFAISRQAVYDILRRAEQILEEYEDALHLVERNRQQQRIVQQVYELLASLPPEISGNSAAQQAMQQLELLLD
ncbi:MAG: putative transcriptional regulator with domain containing protein [Firmicutes bacterium]|nr:putative transcriptional regulator with domain containing protein [Bacillota bacterium]